MIMKLVYYSFFICFFENVKEKARDLGILGDSSNQVLRSTVYLKAFSIILCLQIYYVQIFYSVCNLFIGKKW